MGDYAVSMQVHQLQKKKKKLTILVNDVDNGGGNAWGRGQKIYGNSMYHPLNFAVNLNWSSKKMF